MRTIHFKQLNNQGGGVAIWFIGTLPVIIIFLLLFVNIGAMIDSRITMQAAVDRGAYAGASYLAHVMNETARLNAEFRAEYLMLIDTMKSNSHENIKWIEKQIAAFRERQNVIRQEMYSLIAHAYRNANEIAKEVTLVNLSGSPQFRNVKYKNFYVSTDLPAFEMVDDCPGETEGEQCLNKIFIDPSEILGTAIDPENYDKHEYLVDMYLRKDPVSRAAVAAGARARFVPPLMPEYFAAGGFDVHAIAAAQPYGGSIKEYAITKEEKYLYRPAIVPFKTVLGGADVPH